VLKIGNFEALFLEAFTMGKPYNINFNPFRPSAESLSDQREIFTTAYLYQKNNISF
jgi:hypothetical protein